MGQGDLRRGDGRRVVIVIAGIVALAVALFIATAIIVRSGDR